MNNPNSDYINNCSLFNFLALLIVMSLVVFSSYSHAEVECVDGTEKLEGPDAIFKKAQPCEKPKVNIRNGDVITWNLRDVSKLNSSRTNLVKADKSIYSTISVPDVQILVEAVDKIALSANINEIQLLLTNKEELNAYAYFDKDKKGTVAINKPMFDLIKNDRDMSAALLGHEIAHLYFHHGEASATSKAAQDLLTAVGTIALIFAGKNNNAKLGITGLGLLGTAIVTSYSRDQEREADHQGIIWAKENGYDPNGSVHLFEVFEAKQGDKTLPFFQSHPNPGERIENAKKTASSID
jgi:predicted Zn-dependent protease